MVRRFEGFELDSARAELRTPDGQTLRLRPKALAMLDLFAAHPGRVLSKQDLMDAVWPDLHVGEDSLFQCIREIRTALGDDRRQLIRLVSGRGYMFDAVVAVEQPTGPAKAPALLPTAEVSVSTAPAAPWRAFGSRRRAAVVAAGGVAILALATGATLVASRVVPPVRASAIAVMPIGASDGDGEAKAMAADVTARLADGLAKIENIRVVAPLPPPGADQPAQPDFTVSGELRKVDGVWDMRARMIRTATGEVVWTAPVSVAVDDTDRPRQQTRIAAGIGYPLALRINTLLEAEARPTTTDASSPPGSAKVAIEQASAAIMQTTRERFASAETMLQQALADDRDNVDLAVALAALRLRGIQMVWYGPAESAAAQSSAKSILEQALRVRPTNIAVLQAYCRFLNATNEFVESLVACARTLDFNPWDGSALTHIGLAQLQLGRLEDALATFQQADRSDMPQVSRWTWQLDMGLTYLVMGRSQEALPWLNRSIAITAASGRSYMLLSAAYQHMGRTDDAKAAMDKAVTLRPGSTLINAVLPIKNASPVFLAAADWIGKAFVAAGLPER